METKPLLYGIIGFLLGGFLVSAVAVATDCDTPHKDTEQTVTLHY